MSDQETNQLNNSLRQLIEDALGPGIENLEYPKEALPVGTIIRSTRLDKIGVVIDAFYEDVDADNQKMITYTVLLFPDGSNKFANYNSDDKYYLSNEYEYEIIAYLMIGKANMQEISKHFKLNTGMF